MSLYAVFNHVVPLWWKGSILHVSTYIQQAAEDGTNCESDVVTQIVRSATPSSVQMLSSRTRNGKLHEMVHESL